MTRKHDFCKWPQFAKKNTMRHFLKIETIGSLKMFILLSSWHYNSSYKHALPKLLEGFVRLYFFICIKTPFLSDVTIDKQLHSFKRQLYSMTTLKQELSINPSLVSLPFHYFLFAWLNRNMHRICHWIKNSHIVGAGFHRVTCRCNDLIIFRL